LGRVLCIPYVTHQTHDMCSYELEKSTLTITWSPILYVRVGFRCNTWTHFFGSIKVKDGPPTNILLALNHLFLCVHAHVNCVHTSIHILRINIGIVHAFHALFLPAARRLVLYMNQTCMPHDRARRAAFAMLRACIRAALLCRACTRFVCARAGDRGPPRRGDRPANRRTAVRPGAGTHMPAHADMHACMHDPSPLHAL